MKHILDRTSFAELRELFKRAQKAKEYARHNPPMEKRTTRFICRLGRGAHAFDDAAGGEKVRGGDVVRAEAEALPVGVDERGQAVESVLCPGDEFHCVVHYTKFGRPMGDEEGP